MPFVDVPDSRYDVKQVQERITKALSQAPAPVPVEPQKISYYHVGPKQDVYDVLQYLAPHSVLDYFEFHLMGQVMKYVIRTFYGERTDESLEKARNILTRLQEVRRGGA